MEWTKWYGKFGDTLEAHGYHRDSCMGYVGMENRYSQNADPVTTAKEFIGYAEKYGFLP